jgi:hypothetical protein
VGVDGIELRPHPKVLRRRFVLNAFSGRKAIELGLSGALALPRLCSRYLAHFRRSLPRGATHSSLRPSSVSWLAALQQWAARGCVSGFSGSSIGRGHSGPPSNQSFERARWARSARFAGRQWWRAAQLQIR